MENKFNINSELNDNNYYFNDFMKKILLNLNFYNFINLISLLKNDKNNIFIILDKLNLDSKINESLIKQNFEFKKEIIII